MIGKGNSPMIEEITAFEANQRKPGAHCCNCGDCAGDAPDEQIWFMWMEKLYCPECAEDHGIAD